MVDLYIRIRDDLMRSGGETTAEEIEERYHASRLEAVEAIKQLDRRGYGQYLVGRRTQKTRIRWSRNNDSNGSDNGMAASASRSPSRLEDAPPDDGRRIMDYRFPLDDEVDVDLRLPRDLTKEEAERISAYITTLAR